MEKIPNPKITDGKVVITTDPTDTERIKEYYDQRYEISSTDNIDKFLEVYK